MCCIEVVYFLVAVEQDALPGQELVLFLAGKYDVNTAHASLGILVVFFSSWQFQMLPDFLGSNTKSRRRA